MATPARVRRWLGIYTVAFLAIYVPLETLVTIEIAGIRGLLFGGYLMEWPAFIAMAVGVA